MRKAALLFAASLALSGCRGTDELELRYEAERLRWRIDREEARQRPTSKIRSEAEVAQLRGLHDEVHRRFGATSPPTPAMLKNPDTIRRLRIAGTSSLYGADLAANFHPSAETLAEYESIAHNYQFDRELGTRALFGQGRLLEKLGRWPEALEIDLMLLQRYPPLAPREEGSIPSVNPILLDLELHTLAVAKRIGPEPFAALLETTLPAIESRAEEWRGTKLEREMLLHSARAHFVAELWDDGLLALESARELSPSDRVRIEDELGIAEILWRGKRDLPAAEAAVQRAIVSGKESAFEAEARMDLTRILLAQKKYAAAIEQLEELFRLRPHYLEGFKGEAFYLKGVALVGLEQWADAFPRLKSVAEVDEEGAWAIEARVEMMRRMRALKFGGGEQAAGEAVEIASRVRPSTESREPPFGWEGIWWRPIEEEKWRRCVRGLREIAAAFPEGEFAAPALEQALRLESERIHRGPGEDSSDAVKPSSSPAERDVGGETS